MLLAVATPRGEGSLETVRNGTGWVHRNGAGVKEALSACSARGLMAHGARKSPLRLRDTCIVDHIFGIYFYEGNHFSANNVDVFAR